jgi:hypothetical protein
MPHYDVARVPAVHLGETPRLQLQHGDDGARVRREVRRHRATPRVPRRPPSKNAKTFGLTIPAPPSPKTGRQEGASLRRTVRSCQRQSAPTPCTNLIDRGLAEYRDSARIFLHAVEPLRDSQILESVRTGTHVDAHYVGNKPEPIAHSARAFPAAGCLRARSKSSPSAPSPERCHAAPPKFSGAPHHYSMLLEACPSESRQ